MGSVSEMANQPHSAVVKAFWYGSRSDLWKSASDATRAWMRKHGYSPENEKEKARFELLRLRSKTGRA